MEFPTGGIEEGETPEEAAHRELFEETGTIRNLTYLGMFLALEGLISFKAYAFLATDIQLDINKQRLEDYEQITVSFLTYEEVFQKIVTSEISGTYLMSTLMKYLVFNSQQYI